MMQQPKVHLPNYAGMPPMKVLDCVTDEFADFVIAGKVDEYIAMVRARREERKNRRKDTGG